MKRTIIHKIITIYKNWRLRRVRKKIVFKLISNPNFDAGKYNINAITNDILDMLYFDSLLKPE